MHDVCKVYVFVMYASMLCGHCTHGVCTVHVIHVYMMYIYIMFVFVTGQGWGSLRETALILHRIPLHHCLPSYSCTYCHVLLGLRSGYAIYDALCQSWSMYCAA